MISKLPGHNGVRIALAIVALIVVVAGVDRGREWLEHRSRIFEIERLRSRVGDLRSGVESCRVALERERDSFDRYRASVDSLREEVREYESLDERGVPRSGGLGGDRPATPTTSVRHPSPGVGRGEVTPSPNLLVDTSDRVSYNLLKI